MRRPQRSSMCKLSVQQKPCARAFVQKNALFHTCCAWFFWIFIVSCNCCTVVPILVARDSVQPTLRANTQRRSFAYIISWMISLIICITQSLRSSFEWLPWTRLSNSLWCISFLDFRASCKIQTKHNEIVICVAVVSTLLTMNDFQFKNVNSFSTIRTKYLHVHKKKHNTMKYITKENDMYYE